MESHTLKNVLSQSALDELSVHLNSLFFDLAYNPSHATFTRLDQFLQKIINNKHKIMINVKQNGGIFGLKEVLTPMMEAAIALGIQEEFKQQLDQFWRQNTLRVIDDVQLNLLIDPDRTYPKGHALMMQYYNQKDHELYGYFCVGYFDNNTSFYHLLNLLNKAKNGTACLMWYFMGNEGLPCHVTAIKCEKIANKIHLMIVETTPDNEFLDDIERALMRLPEKFLAQIVLYKNTRTIQSTRARVCFAFSIKLAHKMKAHGLVQSLKERGYLKEEKKAHGLTTVNYEVPNGVNLRSCFVG